MIKARFSLVVMILISLLLLAQPAAARPADAVINTAAIDAAIAKQMDKHGLPGLAAAVTWNDQVVYLKAFGNAAPGRPMTPQTPMYLGSQSKAFTGLAIAQMASEDKIEINAPVQRYIPWFAVDDPLASKIITVNQLLHHTSGMSEAGWTTMLAADTPLEEAVRSLASAKLTAPPGNKFQYFNLNYSTLMLVIENVSGMPYAEYVQTRIFEPLQMAHSYTDPRLAGQNGLAQGYSRLFGFAYPAEQPHRAYALGTGYLMSTAEDMSHYLIALNNQGMYQGSSVLPAGRVSMLFTPVNGYGMGWFIAGDHYFHGGANEAFRTEVNLYPRRKIGFVLLVNEGSMMDHEYISPQLLAAVEAAVLGYQEPVVVSKGWSIRLMGLALLGAVLALAALQTWNFLKLRGWTGRARHMSPGRLAFEVAISFVVPTIILCVLFVLIKQDLGYRFNLTYQMVHMFRTMPEQSMLIVGVTLDYIQGIIKLIWVMQGKTKQERVAKELAAV